MTLCIEEPLKMPLRLISVGHLLLVVCFPSEAAFKTIKFLFTSCLLEMASGLGIEAWVYFSFQLQDSIWCRPTQNLCMLFPFLSVHMGDESVDLEGLVFLLSSIHSGSFTLSSPFLQGSSSSEGRYLMASLKQVLSVSINYYQRCCFR